MTPFTFILTTSLFCIWAALLLLAVRIWGNL